MNDFSRLFPELQRHYLNNRFLRIPRGDEALFATPLSSLWLPPRCRDLPAGQDADLGAKLWQEVLHGISRTADIIFGPRRIHIAFDFSYDDGYRYERRDSVVISTEPAKRPPPGYSFCDVVDAMTGQVIHEAAHWRERQAGAPEYADDDIMPLLYHLVEDAIIDQIVAGEYPGFEGYLLKYRRYYIDWKLRAGWGAQAENRLKQLILSVRSTMPVRISRWSVKGAYMYLLFLLTKHRTAEELRRIDRAQEAERLYGILYDARQADHWRDPDVLSESFVLGPEGPAVKGKNGRNRGGGEVQPFTRRFVQQASLRLSEQAEPEPADDGEQDGTHAKEPGWSKLGSGAWAREYVHEPPRRGKGRKLSPAAQTELYKLEEERQRALDGADRRFAYEATLSLVPLHAQAEQRYRQAAAAVRHEVAPLRNRLARAGAATGRDETNLKSGELDEDALYRAKFAADLFKRRVPPDRRPPERDFVLLVDASRSMLEPLPGGLRKYVAAQRVAALFVEALEPLQHVRTWAYSYSALERRVDIRELLSPDRQADKMRIGDLYPAHQTPEYEALLAVSRHVREAARPGVPKVFIVVSDGDPADDIVPRERQAEEIRRLVKQLEAEGHSVVHIAFSRAQAGAAMYAHDLLFAPDDGSAFVRRFGGWFDRRVGALQS